MKLVFFTFKIKRFLWFRIKLDYIFETNCLRVHINAKRNVCKVCRDLFLWKRVELDILNQIS